MAEKLHLTDQQAEQFRRRTMSPEERLICDRHVATCQSCLERVFGAQHGDVAIARLSEAFLSSRDEPFHLSQNDLKSYVAGLMDEADRTIFGSHLEVCPDCLSQAEALSSSPNSKHVVPATEASPVRSSSWAWLAQAWRWPQVAAAVVVMTCLITGLAVWYKNGSIAQINRKSAEADSIVIRLRDGPNVITLGQTGELRGLEGLDPSTANSIRDALAHPELSKPQALSDLSQSTIKLMGQGENPQPFNLIYPLRNVVGEQPTFRWEALSGTNGYVVGVFDSKFEPVSISPPQATTEWTVPERLRPGGIYFWQVTATKGKQQITVPTAPAPKAQFRVADSGSLSDLARIGSVRPDSHLALGVLYARAGMVDDAERELEMLAKENPESPVARKLLDTVKSWR